MTNMRIVLLPGYDPSRDFSSEHRAADPDQLPRVLASAGVAGPALCVLSEAEEVRLKQILPGAVIQPVAQYRPLLSSLSRIEMAEGMLHDPRDCIRLRIRDSRTGQPVRGARISAPLDLAGFEAVSDADGHALLPVQPGEQPSHLEVIGPVGYWGQRTAASGASAMIEIGLRPINLADRALLLNRIYGHLPADAGTGVTVGIIDTGVDREHPGLPNLIGGANMVTAEILAKPARRNRWGAEGEGNLHGTHVAGVIGMRAPDGTVLRGVAPGAKLRSYRVFPAGVGTMASGFDICAAIHRAVRDGCDVINLSLGLAAESGAEATDTPDLAVQSAISHARAKGSVVIAAAGTDTGAGVSFPARSRDCVAVGAFGFEQLRSGAGSGQGRPVLSAPDQFRAHADAEGPGIGIVATVPGGGYAALSGSSMACPAVTGVAAWLIGSQPELQRLSGAERSDAVVAALHRATAAINLGVAPGPNRP